MKQSPESTFNPEKIRIEEITNQLNKYGEANGIKGLDGRIKRGLDPAGMLAVQEIRDKIIKLTEQYGATIEDIDKLTKELHVGAIWDKAGALAEGTDPAVKTWMSMAEATVANKEYSGDITEQEFILDLNRINSVLDEATNDPEKFFTSAKNNLVDRSKEQFSMDEDVPYSEAHGGFLAMAVNGHRSGIVGQGDNLFVGSNELDFGVLEKIGLKSVEKTDDRNRTTTFYVNEKGEDVVKKLYKGFAIVLNGDKEVAKTLARTGEKHE